MGIMTKPKIAMESERHEDNVDVHELADLLWHNHGDAMDGQDGAGDAEGSTDGAIFLDNLGASESHNVTAPKRFKRHSNDQIHGLKAIFDICPNPKESERLEISKMLGMEATQVLHWFQNQRSQKKAQHVRQESKELRGENEMLRAEHLALKAAMVTRTCFACGGPKVPPEQTPERCRLRWENARLKEEIMATSAALKSLSRMAALAPLPVPAAGASDAAPCYGPAMAAHQDPALEDPALPSPDGNSVLGGEAANGDRADHAALPEFLERAMAEFLTLMHQGEPMWLPTADGEVLDEQLYAAATSPGLLGPRPMGYSMEGTRATAMVLGSAIDIVGVLTDVGRWSETFPGVLAGAIAGDVVVSSGGASALQDGLIQLVNAELRVPSLQAPIRSVNFVRQSKLLEPGRWAVLDVSLDGIHGHSWAPLAAGYMYTACRLLPSGCLIQDLDSGYSKVTWIVNAEYDASTAPQLHRAPLYSGQALGGGARGCLASLQRHCDHHAVMRYGTVTRVINPALSPAGRRSVLELAQRMAASFYTAVCAPPPSTAMAWRRSFRVGAERFEVAMRAGALRVGVGAPGELQGGGLVLSATATVWLRGAPVHRVFDYLCDVERRGEWDALVGGEGVELESYLATGQLHGNAAVSVLRPNDDFTIHNVTSPWIRSGVDLGGADETNTNYMILQEACTDATSSLLVYAPVQEESMRAAMNGGGGGAPVFLLPSGFAILSDIYIKAPDADAESSSSSTPADHGSSDGSLVTAMFQTLQSGVPEETLTAECVDNVGKLLCYAVGKIMAAVVTAP